MITFGDPRLPERFWSKVRIDTLFGCWIWTGSKNDKGYGTFWWGGRMRYTHAVTTEVLVGPIPEDHEIDHLCRVTLCCRPERPHTEPATHAVNLQRGNTGLVTGARLRARTMCANGHPFDDTNTIDRGTEGRGCRVCGRDRMRAHRARKRGSAMSVEEPRNIQNIFRTTEAERTAFQAAAEATGLPYGYWIVQALRAQSGMPAFEPAPRLEPAPRKEPKAKAPKGRADPAVQAKLAKLIGGATLPRKPRPAAREVKP